MKIVPLREMQRPEPKHSPGGIACKGVADRDAGKRCPYCGVRMIEHPYGCQVVVGMFPADFHHRRVT